MIVLLICVYIEVSEYWVWKYKGYSLFSFPVRMVFASFSWVSCIRKCFIIVSPSSRILSSSVYAYIHLYMLRKLRCIYYNIEYFLHRNPEKSDLSEHTGEISQIDDDKFSASINWKTWSLSHGNNGIKIICKAWKCYKK